MKRVLLVVFFCWFGLIGALANPLMNAVLANDLISAKDVLSQGASPDQKDAGGLTPLMMAAGFGNVRMVGLLLSAGADVNLLDSRMGASALHKAAQGGLTAVADLLLSHGAFIDTQAATLGHTPLIDAVWHKNAEMVKFLLARGAKSTLKTHGGRTAFDFAAMDNLEDIMALLEKDRREREQVVRAQPLMAAVVAGNLAEVKRLIAGGTNVNELSPMLGAGNDGHTPLLVAAREGHTEIVRELLKAGASARIVDGLIKATPGHKAGYRGHPDIARLLTNSDLEIDAQGPYNGYTALHDAIWHGHTETAKVLIDACARLDLRGHDGNMPLELARHFGYNDIVALIETRLKSQLRIGENDVRSFVYRWFSWFDKQADEHLFLNHLAAEKLEIAFPETTIRDHSGFQKWYRGIRETIKTNSHEIKSLRVSGDEQKGFLVDLTVRWKAETHQGKKMAQTFRQRWEIQPQPAGKLVIVSYRVKPAR